MTTQTIDWVGVRSPRGNDVQMAVREGTSDLSLVYASMSPPWINAVTDEYGLLDLFLEGVGLDIGASIGPVSAALLADNPKLHMIIVEPLPENVEMIQETVNRNGWEDRTTILKAAVGIGQSIPVAYGYDSTDYGRTNRFIGNLSEQRDNETHQSINAVGFPLADLVAMAGGHVSIAKFDCEGCEWPALAEKKAVANIDLIVGEWHGDPQLPGLHKLLDATHDLTGVAQGVTGIFRAVRR